jgi:epoxide hydrolase-like predicted phosphatase
MASDNGDTAAHGYRGLLVDWGGVMTTDLFASFRAFCEEAGLEPDTIRRRFREDRESRNLLIALETGKLSEEEFEPQFAAKLGIDGAGLIDRLFAGSSVDDRMVAAVAAARAAGIRTGLISNSWGTRRYDRSLLSRLFDGIVISGEVGIRKPAPEIYKMGADSVGLAPPDCVFVDDLPFNLEPATELGMATVHHVSPDQTIPQLEKLLEVKLGADER